MPDCLSRSSVCALLLALPLLAGADEPQAEPAADDLPDVTRTLVVDTRSLTGMDQLLEKLQSKRVIFVGESHDRYEDHLNQLAVITGLREKGRDLAIGLEPFQQPFQPHLDAYVAGEIPEKELLRRSQYFDRWRFDYRLYRPILQYAQTHGIPLIALNLEAEITQKVGDGGIDALSAEERARIPDDIDRGNQDYRNRIRAAFDQHPMIAERDFEHFLEVQLLWDEGMAARAAAYLREHPEKTLVVLAGSGHLEYGQGIPDRLARRLPVPSAILLNGNGRNPDPKLADFLLYPETVALPKPGLLGVLLDENAGGDGMLVQGFSEDSGARDAGIEQGDRILEIGGDPVGSYSDIRIALLGRRPGERLSVDVLRPRLLGSDEQLHYEVELR